MHVVKEQNVKKGEVEKAWPKEELYVHPQWKSKSTISKPTISAPKFSLLLTLDDYVTAIVAGYYHNACRDSRKQRTA